MSKNNLLYLAVAIFVLVGLFYSVKPKPITPNTTTPLSESTKTFNLVVKNKKLVSGSETLNATEGDQVTINISSDEPEEFHLHGYDKSVDLEASKSAQLTFTANLTGRFPYELEKSKTDIGALEVTPK